MQFLRMSAPDPAAAAVSAQGPLRGRERFRCCAPCGAPSRRYIGGTDRRGRASPPNRNASDACGHFLRRPLARNLQRCHRFVRIGAIEDGQALARKLASHLYGCLGAATLAIPDHLLQSPSIVEGLCIAPIGMAEQCHTGEHLDPRGPLRTRDGAQGISVAGDLRRCARRLATRNRGAPGRSSSHPAADGSCRSPREP